MQPPSIEETRRIREFFAEVKYTNTGLQGVLDEEGLPPEKPRAYAQSLPPLVEAAPLRALARWFFLGVSVESETARKCVPDWFLQACLESGLLVEREGRCLPAASIVPVRNLLLTSDPLAPLAFASEEDRVLTVNTAAESLLDFTIQSSFRSTLDLCGGSGIQALACAAHSRHVVTTDLNPRATAFARFNAHLNGVTNLECLTGDLFEPVANRTFDHIVCNPPFVLSPSRRTISCDNPMDLDLFCREIVRQAPRYLTENGHFQMLCEWVDVKGTKWTDRLAEWFQGTECDVWVIKSASFPPWLYAQLRIDETPHGFSEGKGAEYRRWMKYYQSRNVEQIHTGFIMMRRRSGRRFVRMESVSERRGEQFSPVILQAFANQDFLASRDSDEQLLMSRLRLSPDLQMVQEFNRAEEGWKSRSVEIRFTRGFRRKMVVNLDTADFLGRFNGERPVGELMERILGAAGENRDAMKAEGLKLLRQWIAYGYLLPA